MTSSPIRLLVALLGSGAFAQALAAPAVLTRPGPATYVRQVSQTPDGDLCIVGQAMDPDGDAQSRGTVILFSLAKNAVLWQRTVDAPDDNAASRFIACRSDGKSVYVAANVDTHSQQTLNQTLAYVYRFDDKGTQLSAKQLATGAASAFVYGVEVERDAVIVAGGTRDGNGHTEANGMFFARLDPALKSASIDKLATGAYRHDATARLTGNTAYLAGNFAPASVAQDELPDDYAVSRLVAGKYQFSVRPFSGKKASADDVATAITAAGEVVALGTVGRATTLAIVAPNGKAGAGMPVGSAFCRTESVSADAATVYAVRTPCGRSQDPAQLVAIDRKTGTESLVPGVVGEPTYVLALDGKVVVVVRKGGRGLMSQTIAQGR